LALFPLWLDGLLIACSLISISNATQTVHSLSFILKYN
jgi:hypothetical protein